MQYVIIIVLIFISKLKTEGISVAFSWLFETIGNILNGIKELFFGIEYVLQNSFNTSWLVILFSGVIVSFILSIAIENIDFENKILNKFIYKKAYAILIVPISALLFLFAKIIF